MLEIARSLIRLLAECSELDHDFNNRKRHLLSGLCSCLGAQAWIWTQTTDWHPDRLPTYITVLEGGWASDDQRAGAIDLVYSRKYPDPIWRELAKRLDGPLTVTRPQLISDEVWYALPNVSLLRKRAGLDDLLYSIYPISPVNDEKGLIIPRERRIFSQICFCGRWGDAAFTENHRQLVSMAHAEVTWLRRQPESKEPRQRGRQSTGLTSRQREVLLHLMNGDSEKQIALKMGRSVHTVNGHVKLLYEHFRVSSRAQLLAFHTLGQ